MFSNLALITALRHELQPLLALGNWRQEKITGRNFYRRSVAGKEIVATTSGLGKVMAAATTQMLIERFQADLILNFGSCGALDPKLLVGDLVLASRVIEYDFTSQHKAVPTTDCDASLLSELTSRFPDLKVGPLASADRNADTVEIREDLFSRYQALAADWEGASIVRVARRMGVPALVLRGVTDIGDDDLTTEYESNHKKVLSQVAKTAESMTTFLAELEKSKTNL